MAGDIGFIEATGKICLTPNPVVIECEVETGTNCYPGRYVKAGTTDAEVVVNDTSSNEGIGFLGYEQASLLYKPDTIATVYATGDSAPVIIGPGNIIKAKLSKASQTITRGEALTPGSTAVDGAGTLKEATIGTDYVVAIALESVSTTDSVADIFVMTI